MLILDTCYPSFLRAHYEANPELAQQSYAVQWRSLMDTFFGTADSYSYHLRPLGHEAHEVVANCEPLQWAWARERGLKTRRVPAPHRRREAIVLAQAEEFRPDVVYVQNLHAFSRRCLARLKRMSGALVGQIASEAPSAVRLRRFDLLVSSFPHFVERFCKLGIRAAYLRIGFDTRVLARLEDEGAPAACDGPVFVGALNRSQHRTGNALLEGAAQQVPIAFWGYRHRGWSATSAIARGYRGEAWGLEMFRVLRRSRIALNRHIDVAGRYANNMRLYEATGVGTLLLTDHKENLPELFEPGTEVATYRDVDDLVRKLAYYLDDEGARAAVAAAGQRRTLRDHTYAVRMAELTEILEGNL